MFYYKRFRYRRKEQRKHLKTQSMIGVLAVEPGCGATHLAICLASYLTGVKGYVTTIAEVNKSKAFSRLEKVYPVQRQQKNEFMILGISYEKETHVSSVPTLFEAGQESLILDFGADYREGLMEFRRCDIRIVVASMREWKVFSFQCFFEKYEKEIRTQNWKLLLTDASKEDAKILEHRYHINARIVPREEDPFHISRNNLEFYQTILM